MPKLNGKRGGLTFSEARDGRRLNRQAYLVWMLMRDGRWRTLAEISALTGEPKASVSARLRDLRKERFGGHIVDRRHLANGLWQYRVLESEPAEPYQMEPFEAAGLGGFWS